MLAAIILSVSAVLVLLFGTRKSQEDHYVSDRPASLGGDAASTGERISDTGHQASLHSETTESAVEEWMHLDDDNSGLTKLETHNSD